MRRFSMFWLALPQLWLGAVLLRPARFSCFGTTTTTTEGETSAYFDKVVAELGALEDLQETLSQIERVEGDMAKISTDEAAVRSLVGQINQRQLHAVIRMLTELESLELARRDAESAAAAAVAGAGAASGGPIRAVPLPPLEQLEALFDAEAILLESDSEVERWIQLVMEDQVQTMVNDLQSNANGTAIIVEDSAVPEHENCVQPEAAALQVQQAVVNHSHDGISLVDHAQAGTIVHERTSPTYVPPLQSNPTLESARWTSFVPQDWEQFLPPGWQEWRSVAPSVVSHHVAAEEEEAAPPEAILDANTFPGSCWAMSGNSGRVTIRLPYPVKVTAVSIDHASSRLLDQDRMSSAPRKVNVYGYPACSAATDKMGLDFQRRVLLTSLEYDASQGGVQTFPLPPTASAATEAGECGTDAAAASSIGTSDSPPVSGSCRGPPLSAGTADPVGGIEVEVRDNWGKAEYTCLYRVRVHGDASAP